MEHKSNVLFLFGLALALVAVPVLSVVIALTSLNKSLFYENRTMITFPEITSEALIDGTMTTQVESYYSDHLWGRDTLIKLNTAIDLELNRPVIHEIVVQKDVLLPFHGYNTWSTGYVDSMASDMGDSLLAIQETIEQYGGSFFYVGVPSQYIYFEEKYPSYMDNRNWNTSAIHSGFSDALETRDITFLDVNEVYESMGNPKQFFASSDHHYTYTGMLAAYRALMDTVNIETGLALHVYTEDELGVETLSSTFLGSFNRKLYGLWDTEDILQLGHLKTDIPFTRIDNGIKVEPTLYHVPNDEPPTYEIYMGGDIAETVIQTNRPELPNILVFGDSFSNSMETVLWASFNEMRTLDLRYYTDQTLSDYITKYQPDIVVCIRDTSVFLDFTGNGNLQ